MQENILKTSLNPKRFIKHLKKISQGMYDKLSSKRKELLIIMTRKSKSFTEEEAKEMIKIGTDLIKKDKGTDLEKIHRFLIDMLEWDLAFKNNHSYKIKVIRQTVKINAEQYKIKKVSDVKEAITEIVQNRLDEENTEAMINYYYATAIRYLYVLGF